MLSILFLFPFCFSSCISFSFFSARLWFSKLFVLYVVYDFNFKWTCDTQPQTRSGFGDHQFANTPFTVAISVIKPKSESCQPLKQKKKKKEEYSSFCHKTYAKDISSRLTILQTVYHQQPILYGWDQLPWLSTVKLADNVVSESSSELFRPHLKTPFLAIFTRSFC